MKTLAWLLAVASMVTVGCREEGQGKRDLEQQVTDVFSDTEALKEAQAAANELIRNAGDCEAVKGSIGEVNRKLDEVGGKLQTTAGQTTLEALRKQVKTIAETCGLP